MPIVKFPEMGEYRHDGGNDILCLPSVDNVLALKRVPILYLYSVSLLPNQLWSLFALSRCPVLLPLTGQECCAKPKCSPMKHY